MEKIYGTSVKTQEKTMEAEEFLRYKPNSFKHHYGWSSMSQIDGDTFGLEYAHGAADYGAQKMYIVQDEEDIWFLNNGDYSPPSIVKDKIFQIKDTAGFSQEKTECFGQGSTKITSTRIGANTQLYTSQPNQYDVYTVNYPDYFPINNLSDTDWNLLNGKGDDVYVTREQFDFEGYQNQFPSKILDSISFVPTWAMRVKRYGYQEHPITAQWGKMKHLIDMTFVNSDFDFEFIDLTRKSKQKVGVGSQLYFPTFEISDKKGYPSNTKDLIPLKDKKGKQVYFEYISRRRDGSIERINKFAVYHYKFLTEDWNMIEGKKLKSKTDDNIFKPWKTKDSTAYNHFFDHTGKWVFSNNAYDMGMTGVKYNFSNMVFQLVDGKLPYNIIKNQGAGRDFVKECTSFHQQLIDNNPKLQHTGLGKVENAKVESLYNISTDVEDDPQTKQNIISSIVYMAQMSGVTSISYPIVQNSKSHNLFKNTEQGELDWWIGDNDLKTILIEAMNKNLDLIHTRQFKWQLDSFASEVEVGILLIEGNPKARGNQTKINQLRKVIQNRSLEVLKEVWLVSFDDLINGNHSNFQRLDILNK